MNSTEGKKTIFLNLNQEDFHTQAFALFDYAFLSIMLSYAKIIIGRFFTSLKRSWNSSGKFKRALTSPRPDATPFITEFKLPEWRPFTYCEIDPKWHKTIVSPDVLQRISQSLDIYPLNSIFWFFLLKKYSELPYNAQDLAFYSSLLKLEMLKDGQIAFSRKLTLSEVQNPDKGNTPDLISTYYVIMIIHLLGKIPEYLLGLNGQRTAGLQAYLEDVRGRFKENPTYPESQLLFYILSILDILKISPKQVKDSYLPTLKTGRRGLSDKYRMFRLLCLRYFDVKDYIFEEDLLRLHEFQKVNGGFTLLNSAYPNIHDSFWIGYTLDTYRWILPYRAGPLFNYLLTFYKQIQAEGIEINEDTITQIAMGAILYQNILKTILEEAERIIFSNLSARGYLDLDVLHKQAGFHSAEGEVLTKINQKYKFTLEILENEVLFRRFLNKLNPFQEKVASQLRTLIQTHSQLNIKEFRRSFNKKRAKINRVKDWEIKELIHQMMEQNFFHGRLFERRTFLFGKGIFFLREAFVEKIIVSDRPILWEEIGNEKRRLAEIHIDI